MWRLSFFFLRPFSHTLARPKHRLPVLCGWVGGEEAHAPPPSLPHPTGAETPPSFHISLSPLIGLPLLGLKRDTPPKRLFSPWLPQAPPPGGSSPAPEAPHSLKPLPSKLRGTLHPTLQVCPLPSLSPSLPLSSHTVAAPQAPKLGSDSQAPTSLVWGGRLKLSPSPQNAHF